MLCPKTYAYVDESGDSSLNVGNGASSHFILSVILVREECHFFVQEEAKRLRSKHFSGGEMKSSNIGKNDERRISILGDLVTLPITVYVFIVDKREIEKDSGLAYKKSFIKYLHGKVYDRIIKLHPNIEISADQHGSPMFMEEFEKYVLARHISPELGDTATFRCVDSKAEILIQVADIYAGTFAKIFDITRRSNSPERLLKTLQNSVAGIEEWPPVYHRFSPEVCAAARTSEDNIIRELCISNVRRYLQTNENIEVVDQIREAVLIYLANRCRSDDSDDYISLPELSTHLQARGFLDVSDYLIRTKIIAHFRDKGVIIASSSEGYKIPTSVANISDYVQRCDAVIGPMLARLNDARLQIKVASHNYIDILEGESLRYLRKSVEISANSD